MYIYLDESYNLHDRSKSQFLSISGMRITATKVIRKRWKTYQLPFVTKARIHAIDRRFEPLRSKCFKLVHDYPEIVLVSVMQDIKLIPSDPQKGYYRKDTLNFEKVYEDLLKSLFSKLQLQAYKRVLITIDSRKVKGGMLGKTQFHETILAYLKARSPSTIVNFQMQLSSTDILLEMADFISNSFYKYYNGEEIETFSKLEGKTITIKNPLKSGF